jgi:hypothetical protein
LGGDVLELGLEEDDPLREFIVLGGHGASRG